MTRFYQLARLLSDRSPYPIPSKRMAAVVVSAGRVLSRATNISGTCYPGKHAEVRALRPHRSYRGSTLYVARKNGLTSRPCPGCWIAALEAGISRVVYADAAGKVVSERLT